MVEFVVGCVALGNVETNAPINANFLVLAMRAILVVPIVQARVVVTVEAMLTVDMCVDILVDRGVLEIAVALLQDNWGPVLFPNDRSFDITIMNADDIYSEENDIRFARAVTFAMQILQNHFDFMRKQTVLDAKILKVIDDANVKGVNKVFLHEYLPAKAFENSSVHFVAFKGTDPSVDEWMLVSTNSSKYPIKEVEAGVDGCKFIHTAKFMATFNSEEACKKALERQ